MRMHTSSFDPPPLFTPTAPPVPAPRFCCVATQLRTATPSLHHQLPPPSCGGSQDLHAAASAKAPLAGGVAAGDVGALAAFLAGPGGARITGQTLYVDGGASAVL